MNYQHLYAYLETRPIDELKECMNNVVSLAKKRTASVDQTLRTEESIILNADKVLKELQQLRVAQRIWTQEAISGKFGPVVGDECLTKPEVISYLVHVNSIIDERVQKNQEDTRNHVLVNFSYAPVSPCAAPVDAESEICSEHVRKQARGECTSTNTDIADTSGTGVGSPALGKREVEQSTVFWTPDMVSIESDQQCIYRSKYAQDSTLLQHVLSIEDPEDADWTEVAEHVGNGATGKKSEKRWTSTVEPQQRGLKKSEAWTEADVQKLFRLVSQHTTPPVWIKHLERLSEERIDWVKISQEMGRVASSCRAKWNTRRQRNMKGGPFTPAEDALIRQRVAEWGNKGKGLWVSLEKEMNRRDDSLVSRWKTLSARV